MATQFEKELADILDRLSKTDRVTRWQEYKKAKAQIDAHFAAMKGSILKEDDQRFEIREESIRESAPSKAEYIRIHGKAAYEKNKSLTKVKRHVHGIR